MENQTFIRVNQEKRQRELIKFTELFFNKRFPHKDLRFEKQCGYFYEWVERFKKPNPQLFMDDESLIIWELIKYKFPQEIKVLNG